MCKPLRTSQAMSVTHTGPAAKCSDLLQALKEQETATAEAVVSLACQFVAPFQDLLGTLVEAADSIVCAGTCVAIREAVQQFRVDILCEKGQILKQARDSIHCSFSPG